jgi:MFS family permease
MREGASMTDETVASEAAGRPIRLLPWSQLIRLSLYWLGLSAIFGGMGPINQSRLVYMGIGDADQVGTNLAIIGIFGTLVAIVVQPTAGTISDYTMTRWGRRKPFIFIGSLLDVVFLFGLATSNTVLMIAVFLALLQFSSNFAQGPFQGYVPDLVPAPQVGTASSLVGLMQVLGVIIGSIVAALALATSEYFIAIMVLAAIELATMLSVVIRVDDGRTAKPRNGKPWRAIALEAWGTDILKERSYVWLVASRLFILMGSGTVTGFVIVYLSQALHLGKTDAAATFTLILITIAIATVIVIVPAGRRSDKGGRKRYIWISCVLAITALLLMAIAPGVPVLLVAGVIFGAASGMFLAVDWALMTDIIPKASAGRYMGISNLATASSGLLAIAAAGPLSDFVNGISPGAGPRVAMILGACWYVVGAFLLRPVDERRREDGPLPIGAIEVEPVDGLPAEAAPG